MAEACLFNHSSFRAYLAEHKLMAAHCTACGDLFLPPRPLCSHCYSRQMEWVELSGEGQLATFTAISVGLPALTALGYNRQHPYCTGIVRLAEGPLISGRLLDFDYANPAQIQIGTPVQAAFIDPPAGSDLPVSLAFRPIP